MKWQGLASRGYLVGKQTPASNSKARTNRRIKQLQARAAEREDPEACDDDAEPTSGLPSPIWTPSAFQALDSFVFDDVDELQTTADSQPEPVSDYDHRLPLSSQLFVPSPRPAMAFFEIPSDLSFILNYHLSEVAAKLCVDNNALANPYRQYIYPLALQKPSLLYACAAMSSVHYSTCQDQESFLIEALRLRGKALSRLQESMWSSTAAMDEGNLATILMLILCDMCMGGHSSFEMYFTLAKRLIEARAPARTTDNFVEQYISWLDIMSCASTPRKPVFSTQDVVSLRGNTTAWAHDVIPCPAEVFDVLQQAVALRKETPCPADLAARIEDLRSRLLMSAPHSERGLPWLHLTEAYRHASLLYLLILFDLDADEDEVDWLVSSIIQHAKSTPSRSGWSDQLLWPLFHAGLKIKDIRRQEWLRNKLMDMQSSGGFRNVTSAIEALSRVWDGTFSGKYDDLLVEDDLGDLLVI